MTATEIIRAGQVQPTRPWPRYAITSQAWREMARELPGEPELRFEALWADEAQIYALFTRKAPLLVSAPVEAGVYGALSPYRPEASLYERAVSDLWGHLAADAIDQRPSLDHGVWPVLRPMLRPPVPNTGEAELPEQPALPHGMARLQLGPVGGPATASLTLNARGETVSEVDVRLGYAHRGVLALVRGRSPAEAAPLAARLGAGGVAHSLAFARAIEAALSVDPPPRAIALRAIAAELERTALGLHDLAAALEAAGFDPARSIDGRETLLRATELAFGRRLLLDLVIPGGVARDLAPEGAGTLSETVERLAIPTLTGLRRGGAAWLEARATELRELVVRLPTRLRSLRDGALSAALPPGASSAWQTTWDGEGLGRADGPRGPHWHWLQVREGKIAQLFAADPLLWPEFQAECRGAALDDLPVLAAALGSGGADW